MNIKKTVNLILIFIFGVVVGLLPTKFWISLFSKKGKPQVMEPKEIEQKIEKPILKPESKPRPETQPITKIKKPEIKKSDEEIQKPVEEVIEKKEKPEFEIAKKAVPEREPESVIKHLDKQELVMEMFDPMESTLQWRADSDSDANSNFGLFKGVDSKSLALYYSLDRNGWAGISKKGEWDFGSYKGMRFACKIDGQPGELSLKLENENGVFIKKSWDEDELKGSVWRVFSVFFTQDLALQKMINIKESNIKNVEFEMVSNTGRIKGRILIDNIELIK